MIAAFVWLWASAALAQEPHGVVTLDLRPEVGDTPTHLCVVGQAKSGRLRERLRELLEPDDEKIAAAGGTEATVWRVRPKAWDGTDASAERQRCSTDPLGDCRPRVELPASLASATDFYAACTVDSLAEGGAIDDPRPLFVLLEHLEGSPPQVTSIRLAGGVATIGVDADLGRVVVTARSLGGAYLPHKRSERGVEEGNGESTTGGNKNVLVQLPLTPRCRVVELTLPGTALSEADRARLQVRAHGIKLDVAKCVGPLTGRDVLQVRVPQAPLRVGSIDVELRWFKGRPGAQFGGRYTGSWPEKVPYALTFKQVTFRWRRPPCIFPVNECPTATLETGTVCEATSTPAGCDYRCPGTVDNAAIDLVLPQKVKFEKSGPDQKWEDTVARAGQQLTSYVEAPDIYLSANVSTWKTDIPDNRISAVEIYGEDGEARRYGIGPLPLQERESNADQNDAKDEPRTPRDFRLKVPGASCEPVRFKPIGDRHYDEGVAQVTDGKLVFTKPERTARIARFNITLAVGGGPAFSSYRERGAPAQVYFSGLGMLSVELRPRKPKFSRIAFEPRVGGTLGRYATTLDPDTLDPDEPGGGKPTSVPLSTRTVGWARLLVEPGMVFSLHERVALGAGFGLGVALPFRSAENLVGDRLRFIYSPNVDVRIRAYKFLKLLLQFRGVLNEQAFAQGKPLGLPTSKSWAGSFLILFGAQFSF
ncbi:MAG TPA: hypothetical protein VG755_08955 [Nannocystaceae bacterium]|nr:hypothetical protein [Nannocystaceae bacterium]